MQLLACGTDDRPEVSEIAFVADVFRSANTRIRVLFLQVQELQFFNRSENGQVDTISPHRHTQH